MAKRLALHISVAPSGIPFAALALLAAALGLGAVLLQLLPVEGVNTLTWMVCLMALGDAYLRRNPMAAFHHLLACALLLVCVYKTDSLRDYYRYWGGSLRRSGQIIEATMAYERVTEIDPDYASGHRHLGDLYRSREHWQLALEAYERGLAIKPNDPKLSGGAALSCLELGLGDKAQRYAEHAIANGARDVGLRSLAGQGSPANRDHAPQR